MDNRFITPEGHRGFLAKKLFDEMGAIRWGALAYIEPGGGGPEGGHTHGDDHIFIVADGEVEIRSGDSSQIVKKDGMCFVDGMTLHSIWNHGEITAKVVKISVERRRFV